MLSVLYIDLVFAGDRFERLEYNDAGCWMRARVCGFVAFPTRETPSYSFLFLFLKLIRMIFIQHGCF